MDTRIDEPGAGKWIMDRAQGFFIEGRDHSFSAHYGSEMRGGFVLQGYLGRSASIHMAGEGRDWCSRELLWLVFHYAFVQLNCRKLFGPVRSDNYQIIDLNLRGGWRLDTVLHDVFDDAHLLIMSMTKEQCPWLDYTPTRWRPGDERAAE